ncbi:hypothetical protein L6164_021462 [Bauhinia variegata]|uniref:Uncharacterized protein n=1 Tax=Bauhinia variegata TaxID=167791 RepID=A0ACB9MYE2_BAUVA|nr:hypothetical protein L6164_021462 [Bauhinia variegata]
MMKPTKNISGILNPTNFYQDFNSKTFQTYLISQLAVLMARPSSKKEDLTACIKWKSSRHMHPKMSSTTRKVQLLKNKSWTRNSNFNGTFCRQSPCNECSNRTQGSVTL